MNATIEEVAPCRKRIEVRFDVAEVDKEFEDSFSQVKNVSQLPGFRKGRVPRKIVERRFGDHVREEVRNRLFQKGFMDALKQQDLSPLGDPEIDIDSLAVQRGNEFSFSTEVDVRPAFELGEYKGLELVEEVVAVADEEVEERLKELQARFAEQEEKDGPAEEGDLVEGSVVFRSGEEEIFNQESRALRVTGTTVFGLEVGPLVEKLGGMRPGEGRSITLTLPESYPREEFRGKEGEITITAAKVLQETLPELDDAFAQRLGLDSLEEIKAQIRSSIEEERKREGRTKLERVLSEKLIEAHPFDIPEGVRQRQAEANLRQSRMRLMYMGLRPDMLEEHMERMRAESERDAEFQIRRMIIFDAIADKENVEVGESDVQMHIANLAQAYRVTPQEMARDIEKRGGFGAVYAEIRDIKVTQMLLEEAKIETRTVEAASDDETGTDKD